MCMLHGCEDQTPKPLLMSRHMKTKRPASVPEGRRVGGLRVGVEEVVWEQGWRVEVVVRFRYGGLHS